MFQSIAQLDMELHGQVKSTILKYRYSQVSNKQAGWNKHAGRGKSWKANKQAGSIKQSGWGKNLKFNKHAGIH